MRCSTPSDPIENMYLPQHFEVTSSKEIEAFIKSNPFGQLISTVESRLFSSHLPFALKQQTLFCHLAKGNPQWRDIEKQEVLVSFQGAHDYISPSWYQSPGVPTWNYQAIHIYGKAKIISDNEALRGIVNELTEDHEARFSKPWTPQYREKLLEAIIGIEIEIREIQGKYKLSQNRPEIDRKRIIEELNSIGSAKLSKAMKQALS